MTKKTCLIDFFLAIEPDSIQTWILLLLLRRNLPHRINSATYVSNLKGHSRRICSVAFHPKLPLLTTGDESGTVKLWHFSRDCFTATCVASLKAYSSRICSGAFHPKLPLIATASSYDNTVKLWR